MTQRTKLGRLWLHERLVKLVEDDHSLTSTETTQVGHGSEACTQARLF